jgi:hypothetical protein
VVVATTAACITQAPLVLGRPIYAPQTVLRLLPNKGAAVKALKPAGRGK